MNSNIKMFAIVLIAVAFISVGLIFVSAKQKKLASKSSQSQELQELDNQQQVAGASTNQAETQDSSYIEKLAKFLSEKGMVMYGAYWCPHCQEQKKEFGDAFKYVDYVECDAQGPNANPDECVAQGIEGYPTWVYQGQKYSGSKSLSELANIVGFSD